MVKQRPFQQWKRYLPMLSKTIAWEYFINVKDTERCQNSTKFVEIKIKTAVKIKQTKTLTINGVDKNWSSQK
jgi:hypothetical protein